MKTFGFLLVLISAPAWLRADDKVTVHEWGTFTCLQDDEGNAIGGINIDDEPVPDFVYTVGQHRVAALNHNLLTFGLPPYSAFAGKTGTAAPVGDPAVTMRLETPVLYIYPPKGKPAASVPPLDVHVDFHGGVLSQYYPWAKESEQGPGSSAARPASEGDHLASIIGTLEWNSVRLGSRERPIETDNLVWATPRETSAPLLEVHPEMKKGDSVAQVEHFLFYRGVGHVNSPLVIESIQDRRTIYSYERGGDIQKFDAGWLVNIQADGTCAFHFMPSPEANSRDADIYSYLDPDHPFEVGTFARGNLAKLRTSMHDALVKEGLYPDEATAMLKTWELSYFKSPGLRFFYIVPRKWVDDVLPLKVTGAPVGVTRVMVGRIELISDVEKAALARLAQEPYPDLAALKHDANQAILSGKFSKQEQADFYSGSSPLTDLGITLSPGVRDYLSLGRFRDALIVHQQHLHPSANLARFIQENGLATTAQ